MSETTGRHAADPDPGDPGDHLDGFRDGADDADHLDEPAATDREPGVLAPEGEHDERDDYLLASDYAPAGGRRRAKRRGARSCLVFVVIFALVMVGGYLGLTKGIRAIQDQFGDAADYPGPGSGAVTIKVAQGDSIAAIGRQLKAQDVVASVDAFLAAANANSDATGIQGGTYTLMAKMKASDAVAALVTPPETTKVTIPEGLRVVDIVAKLSEATGIGKNKFNQALGDAATLGLPDYAGGSAEGYLFPATYDFPVSATPAEMLTAMVTRWKQSAASSDLEAKAQALGYTPQEVMTVASLVQAEGRGDDMAKIARVIYNRLDDPTGPTVGKLQIDATVNFALDRSLVAVPTLDDLEVDSPYNTYANAGLPPGPIEAPGDAAIDAALNPAKGNWLFYVTVDLATGETKFTDSYDEFLGFKQELRDYCANESKRC